MRGMTQETDITGQNFIGAKLALFLGDSLITILRDDTPEIPWPGRLDLPGGGREGQESPQDCVMRETREELGLAVGLRDLRWGQRFIGSAGPVWFFAAHLHETRVNDVVFGNEGQGWHLMTPAAYLSDPLAIPHFQDRLRLYLRSM
jgi:8-oxo-dGTP diphosphatase